MSDQESKADELLRRLASQTGSYATKEIMVEIDEHFSKEDTRIRTHILSGKEFCESKFRNTALEMSKEGYMFEFIDTSKEDDTWEVLHEKATFNSLGIENGIMYRLKHEIPWTSIEEVPISAWFRRKEDHDTARIIGFQKSGQYVCFTHDKAEWIKVGKLLEKYEYSDGINGPTWSICGKTGDKK